MFADIPIPLEEYQLAINVLLFPNAFKLHCTGQSVFHLDMKREWGDNE